MVRWRASSPTRSCYSASPSSAMPCLRRPSPRLPDRSSEQIQSLRIASLNISMFASIIKQVCHPVLPPVFGFKECISH
uniref:Uncharacterized protein n=1 Tax=Arundo donax TaxID=35708 RepID=A0A0A9DIB1_ARUDO